MFAFLVTEMSISSLPYLAHLIVYNRYNNFCHDMLKIHTSNALIGACVIMILLHTPILKLQCQQTHCYCSDKTYMMRDVIIGHFPTHLKA